MNRTETIGFRVRTLSVAIKRAIDAGKPKEENGKYTGTQVKVDNEEYTIVRQSDVLAIVKD